MELSEIREKIDTVDDQLLKLFLERMSLAEEVAAYKNEHHLPILNKERERAVLARVTEQSGEKERYAYHLFSTLFELARSRQAELISAPTRVAAQVKASLEAGSAVFPQTGLVGCQGVEGAILSDSKKKIEETMDTLVVGFEQQLDKLFQDDALDLSADISVLKNMMAQDGLSGEESPFAKN